MTPDKLTLEQAMERLCDAEHDDGCIRRAFQAGRPTADGGYECCYRVRGVERWFRARPVDETPKCDCGLDAAAALLRDAIPFVRAAMPMAEWCEMEDTREDGEPLDWGNGQVVCANLSTAYRTFTEKYPGAK